MIIKYCRISGNNRADRIRVYTNEVRLRGLRMLSTREGGFCLCRRDFPSPELRSPELRSPKLQSFTIHRNAIILLSNYRQQMLVQLHRLQTTINPRNCPIVLLNLQLILSLPPQISSNLFLSFLC